MHDTFVSRAARAIVSLTLTFCASACAQRPIAPRVADVTPAAPLAITPPSIEPAPIIASVATTTPVSEPRANDTDAAPRERVRAVVLLYHMLNGLDDEMAITPASFEEQIRWLVDHDIRVVSTSDLLDFLDGKRTLPERVAVIQIDDGHASAYAKAYPVLKRHGLPFTLALNTAAMEAAYPNTMSWDAVREMLSSGLCEVASHSHIHGHMDKLTDRRNVSEAVLSKAIIEARTGVRPEAFVFPFGANTERVRRTVEEAGYRAAFEVGGIAARADSPRYRVPRVTIGHSMPLASFARLFGDRGGVAKARATAAPKRG